MWRSFKRSGLHFGSIWRFPFHIFGFYLSILLRQTVLFLVFAVLTAGVFFLIDRSSKPTRRSRTSRQKVLRRWRKSATPNWQKRCLYWMQPLLHSTLSLLPYAYLASLIVYLVSTSHDGAVHLYCWCPWSTVAAFCRNQIGWLCLQLDCPPSVAELSRLPPLKSGTLERYTSSQLPRCSPSGVTWKRFYYNNLSAYSTLVDLVVASVI